jgi:PEP-CTERM motif
MNFFNQVATMIAISIAALNMPAKSAIAFTITQNNEPDTLLNYLLGDTTGLSNFELNLLADARAFGIFQDDPFRLKSGVVLSTGKVEDLVAPNIFDDGFFNDLSHDFGEIGLSGDSITLEISFDADDTKDTFFFQYVFGSEEFVEYGGSQFNDNFSLKLNGFNLARLSDGKATTINNLVPNRFGGYHPDFVYNSVDAGLVRNLTRLDGYTKPLLFQGPLIQNARNTLVINIQDVKDGVYDSVVLLKAGTMGTVKPPLIGDDDTDGGGKSVPEPTTSLGALMFGIFTTGFLLRKRQRREQP